MNMTSSYKVQRNFSLFMLVIATLLFESCGVYSFTGASIAPDIKTISIQYFPNYAPLVQPSLSQLFTDKLKERFSIQTSLGLVKNNGDLQLEGTITDYNIKPQAITGDNASLSRLTITVKVKFTNNKDVKQNFESNFTRFVDYPASQNLSSVEIDLIKKINEQLVDDIFNKSVVNW